MHTVSDYVVVEKKDEQDQPFVEIWVDMVSGGDGVDSTQLLAAQRDGNNLMVFDPIFPRSIADLKQQVWDNIELTGEGVLVVCGPSGILSRKTWRLQ